jgi:exodeoxyribonuclease III
MKLATWNVNSLGVRLPQVLDWLAANPVDVLALQELKLTDEKFPADAFSQVGYHAEWFGQKTYNGVALLSRTPQNAVIKNIPGFEDDMSRVITSTVVPLANSSGLRVVGAYFPNGQEPGSDKFEYKMEWLSALRRWIREELVAHPRLVLMGDYNITFDEADMWDPVGLQDTIHCTEEERYHLRALVSLGLHDSHRMFAHPPKSFSWWDYRDGGFKRNRGLRIDHILVSTALKPCVTACNIDTSPRRNDRPSDHAPVVVELSEF